MASYVSLNMSMFFSALIHFPHSSYDQTRRFHAHDDHGAATE